MSDSISGLRLGIIGGGRAAWAFGSTWRRVGWPLSGIATRDGSTSRVAELLGVPRLPVAALSAQSDLLLLAVNDRSIEAVANAIPSGPSVAFHVSGSLPHVGSGFSLHPLRVLPPAGEPIDLRGTLLVFEGNHRDIAASIASTFGSPMAEIASNQKARYHAAAVFGANYVAAVLDIAQSIFRSAGIAGAEESLAALARSAIENWASHSDERRFTGPAARGDDEVIARHLEALRDEPAIAEIYARLAAQIRTSILAARK